MRLYAETRDMSEGQYFFCNAPTVSPTSNPTDFPTMNPSEIPTKGMPIHLQLIQLNVTNLIHPTDPSTIPTTEIPTEMPTEIPTPGFVFWFRAIFLWVFMMYSAHSAVTNNGSYVGPNRFSDTFSNPETDSRYALVTTVLLWYQMFVDETDSSNCDSDNGSNRNSDRNTNGNTNSRSCFITILYLYVSLVWVCISVY